MSNNLAALVTLRRALPADVPALDELIARSTKELQAPYYTPAQLAGALRSPYGAADRKLVAEGSYFVACERERIVGCGGWSEGKPSSAPHSANAAWIRAFFVDPAHARKGIGGLLLRRCEAEAAARGIFRLELTATLSGAPFYLKHGYVKIEDVVFPLAGGEMFPLLRMEKTLPHPSPLV